MPVRRTPGDWLARITHARSGHFALYWFAFLEGVFIPIPFEAVLAPYMQMRRDIMWWLAAIGLAGYLTAAMMGFAIGLLFYESVGEPMIATMGWQSGYERAREYLSGGGFWAMVLIVALPIPSMAAMIGAGALGIPVTVVAGAVLLVRGARYFGAGLLVYLFGDRVVGWFRLRAWRARRARRARRDQPPPR